MTITELQGLLEIEKLKHGNIPVHINEGDTYSHPIESLRVDEAANTRLYGYNKCVVLDTE